MFRVGNYWVETVPGFIAKAAVWGDRKGVAVRISAGRGLEGLFREKVVFPPNETRAALQDAVRKTFRIREL